MAVTAIDLLKQAAAGGPSASQRAENRVDVPSFGETLEQFLSDVNELQLKAGQQMSLMATGQAENLHEVMISAEKASISFELLMEIRNKVLEAYQELMRMQV